MHLVRTPGFFRTLGHRLGDGLADIILDRIAPPPPSLAQQILDEAPKVLAFVTMIANATRPAESKRPAPHVPHDVIGGTVVPSTIGLRAEDFPPFKKLGEFTCPKCGGHTWSWTGVNGVDENGTRIRMCSGDLWRHTNCATGPERCNFTWKATDDAKYFSSVEVGPAPEQACVAPSPAKGSKNAWQDAAHASLVREIDKIRGEASWESGDFLPLHILLDDISSLGVVARSADALPGESKIATVARLLRDRGRGDTYEEIKQLVDAVGNRHDGVKTVVAAATIIRDADAFIAKQAEAIRSLTEQVRELILDSEFSAGRGEVGITLTEAEAKAIDDRGNVPHGELVTLVLRDHRWTIRVKHVAEAALKPGDATPPNPTYVHLRVKQDVVAALLFARDQMPQADQTDMAQNAAGGVA